jgi:hypothetical protein
VQDFPSLQPVPLASCQLPVSRLQLACVHCVSPLRGTAVCVGAPVLGLQLSVVQRFASSNTGTPAWLHEPLPLHVGREQNVEVPHGSPWPKPLGQAVPGWQNPPVHVPEQHCAGFVHAKYSAPQTRENDPDGEFQTVVGVST